MNGGIIIMKKEFPNILLNVTLWILLLIAYFIFVFIVDGLFGIGFKDQWKQIKKWFIKGSVSP